MLQREPNKEALIFTAMINPDALLEGEQPRLIIILMGGSTEEDIIMEELDCVKLIKPFRNLKTGTNGTILIKYAENDFEVEFFDDNHEIIDVYTITGDCLEVYLRYSNCHGK